jgi:hypothetical protein
MASTSEDTLLNWTKPPSDNEESKCENSEKSIKDAIANSKGLAKYRIEVFAQGSYPNNTNVRLNSDVDIVVRNMSAFYYYLPTGKTTSDFGIVDSEIRFLTFKEEVRLALVDFFGEKFIKPGRKAVDVLPERDRLEADVVSCMEHRRYTGEIIGNGGFAYYSGIEFYTTEGKQIVSWPIQHKENGIVKNKRTGTTFKKVVRILRRLNYKMIDDKIAATQNVTGYLLECLCWNLSDDYFAGTSYLKIVREIIVKLYEETIEFEKVKDWTEISGLEWLFKGEKSWTFNDVNTWMIAAWNYLGFK